MQSKVYIWRGLGYVPYGEGMVVVLSTELEEARRIAIEKASLCKNPDVLEDTRAALKSDPDLIIGYGEAEFIEFSE